MIAAIFQFLFPTHRSHILAHKFPIFLQDLVGSLLFLGFLFVRVFYIFVFVFCYFFFFKEKRMQLNMNKFF